MILEVGRLSSVYLEALDIPPDEAVKHGGQAEGDCRGSEEFSPEVREVVTETVPGLTTSSLSPESAGGVHQSPEHQLPGDEGDQGQGDLLYGHAQGLVTLVDTPDVDQEVPHPAQAEDEVEDELSDEEGPERSVAVRGTVSRDRGAGEGAGALQEGGGVVEGLTASRAGREEGL